MHKGRTSVLTLVLAVVLVATAAACSSSKSNGGRASTTSTTATTVASGATTKAGPSLASPCGRSADPPATYAHVVIMLEENRTWTGGRSPAIGLGFSPTAMPFLHGLATKCAFYTDWVETNGGQNSLSQYVGLTSGVANKSTVNDCDPLNQCVSTDDNVFRQVRVSGGTPRTFVDGATGGCSAGANAPKHIPALYYQGGRDKSFCSAEVRPLSELDPDHLPTLAFVVPDLCHDGHDCSDAKVDAFATTTLTPILNGTDYAKGETLVVVVYDEDRPVPNLLIAPTAHSGAIKSVAGSHAALLKTVEQALGLPVMKQGQLPAAISLRSSSHL